MADTPNLVLPYLAANQSQKHVTVNEALRRLDALVQISVQSAAMASPPASPTEGQRWIVPAAPTGAWAGHAGQIAAWQDGTWAFYAPQDGWTAVDLGSDTLLIFNAGTGVWANLITGIFSDAAFTLQDDLDPTRQARFQIGGFTTGATRVFTLPDATTTLAGLAVAQTFSAKQTLSNANNDLGTSSATGTTNLAIGATLNGNSKTVNIGTAGVAGSTTNVTIGSAVAGALGALTINSPTVTFGSSVSAIAMAAANVSALHLGLGGATADATNRLSLNAPASLFNHAGAGHQVKLNKAAASDTGSLLFQTGFSGRAEIGLTGSDDLQIKVSGDGATWFTALQLERTSGRLRVLQALQLNPNAGDPGTVADGDLWYNATSGKFRARQAGSSIDLIGGGGAGSTSWAAITGTPTTLAGYGISDALDLASSQTVSGAKTFSGAVSFTGTPVFIDAGLTLQDDLDATKKAQFQLSGIGTGQTRSFSFPNVSGNLVVDAQASPTLFTAVATQTVNIATGVTASGSSKTINLATGGASGSTTNITLGSAVAGALGTLTVNSPNVVFGATVTSFAIADSVFTLTDNLDATRKLQFDLAGLTTSTTRTLTIPDKSGTIALTGDITGSACLIPASGEDIATCTINTTLQSQGGIADRLLLFPFFAPRAISFSAVKINVTNNIASSTAKVVVYDSDANGRPNTLLGETATIDTGTATGFKTAALALTLTGARTYWFGLRFSATQTVSAWPAAGVPHINGGSASTTPRNALQRTVTFANPAPSSWGWNPAEIANFSAPAIWLVAA